MQQQVTKDWTIPGAEGEAIRGQTHWRAGETPGAVVLLGHGFKGYKDYGFLPLLAADLAEQLPLVVHRFNFSHSGLGDNPSTFQRADLFEKDTWNKLCFDLNAMIRAARAGELPKTPADLPIIPIGHSRGGVTTLLTLARRARDGDASDIAAAISMSAPAMTLNLKDEQVAIFKEQGYMSSPSSRTGQELRLGRAWLEEQLDDPEAHNLLALCSHIKTPVLIMHGDADPTIPVQASAQLADAITTSERVVIESANHVFNTPNPADPSAQRSDQLAELTASLVNYLSRVFEFPPQSS